MCDEDFRFFSKGGATFQSLGQDLNCFFDRSLRRSNPEVIYVFLGSNDIDKVEGTGEVNVVINDCKRFHEELRSLCPQSKIIYAQVEDRYVFNHLEDPNNMLQDFKAKSNKFNKWLNNWKGKDGLFVLKGANGFSDPSLYARDGVHLNLDGNKKLAGKLNNFVVS